MPRCFKYLILLLPLRVYGSFIEATMGTAVVNDATATYHNPAALILVDKAQIIGLSSKLVSHSKFVGQSIELPAAFIQSGIAKEHTNYNLPSGYMTYPIHKKVHLGFAVLGDNISLDIDEPSILKYDQATNQIKNIDYVLGVALRLHDYLSLGAGVTYSNASFASHKIIGFPSLDIPDSQSHNMTKGDNFGWNAGFLIEPLKSTKIGFNYRSAIAYQFNGTSEFEGPPAIISNQYNFNFWTPARSVITLSHFVTPTTGFIATLQWVQWSVFETITMHALATHIGNKPSILPTAIAPYHFKDSWVLTFGGIKKFTPEWTMRIAGTYNQSPGNGLYRITSGDDYIVGASTGYKLYKNIEIDASYAHAFTKNRAIDITSPRKHIVGVNTGYRDSVSLKLTASG